MTKYGHHPIRLTQEQWEEVLVRIKQEYADTPSVWMIRSKMRDALGFLPREVHQQRLNERSRWWEVDVMIEIDFFGDEEAARAWFILKYT